MEDGVFLSIGFSNTGLPLQWTVLCTSWYRGVREVVQRIIMEEQQCFTHKDMEVGLRIIFRCGDGEREG